MPLSRVSSGSGSVAPSGLTYYQWKKSRLKRNQVRFCELCGAEYHPRRSDGGPAESEGEAWPSLRDYCRVCKRTVILVSRVVSQIFYYESVGNALTANVWRYRFKVVAETGLSYGYDRNAVDGLLSGDEVFVKHLVRGEFDEIEPCRLLRRVSFSRWKADLY